MIIAWTNKSKSGEILLYQFFTVYTVLFLGQILLKTNDELMIFSLYPWFTINKT